MLRRAFLKITVLIAVAASNAVAVGFETSRQPNLVFVFSDQQSSDMLGCYGNDQIITPNIDKMAAEGVRFNHCISSSPVCTPYRGMLLSGQHPLYNGCMVNDIQMLPGSGNHFGEVLRDAGYHTGYIGKWHLHGGLRGRPIPAGPLRYGFDHEFFSNNCTEEFGAKDAFFWGENGERAMLGKWEPDGQTDQALAFIDRYAGKQPFALFISWHPPHNWDWGYPAPTEYENLYDPAEIKLRPSCADTQTSRLEYRGYMAMCTNLDNNFARLMEKLDEKGISDNTLVVYTSDHGDLLRSHGIHDWHKSRPEHVSCRVPLILRWPDKLSPRVSDMLMGTLDLMPTLLGLLGIEPPKTCQGSNYADALMVGKDRATESVPLFFWGDASDWRGVYTHRYTYAFEPPGATRGINVLYDRQEDPHEMKNLFTSHDHQKVREEIHALTKKWMAKFRDEHVPWDTVKHKIYVDPAAARAQWAPLDAKSAALKGRPVDLLDAPLDPDTAKVDVKSDQDTAYRNKERIRKPDMPKGGISVQHILTHGSAEDVKDETKRIIDHLAPGDGYILSPGHPGVFQDDIPVKNIITMYETTYEYGFY